MCCSSARWLRLGKLLLDIGQTGSQSALLRELKRIDYYNTHLWKVYYDPLYGTGVFFLIAVSFESWAFAMTPWSWLLHASFALLLLGPHAAWHSLSCKKDGSIQPAYRSTAKAAPMKTKHAWNSARAVDNRPIN